MGGDRVMTKDVARGRWDMILPALGVPKRLLNKIGQPCPFCGGKDRFQWKDYQSNGGFICRQCGNGDGFELLKRFNKWTFQETARRIDDLLHNDYRISLDPKGFARACIEADEAGNKRPLTSEVSIPKSVRDCALWIRKFHPDRLEAWLDRHDIEVRWWLETQ